MGLSKLGQHDLNDNQFEMLVAQYINPKRPDKILWTQFMSDVESGKYFISKLFYFNIILMSYCLL